MEEYLSIYHKKKNFELDFDSDCKDNLFELLIIKILKISI